MTIGDLHGAATTINVGGGPVRVASIDWSLGTHQGLAHARARSIAATPQQRLAWLEDALLLALASGAITRDRAERQRAIDEVWGTGEGPPR